MSSLVAELKRRNVFRVALAYIIVGWVVLQVAETLAPLMQLPEWTVSLTLYIGIIGFPFALLFAWAFELTPQGLKRSNEVAAEDSITNVTASHINRLLTLLLVVALGMLVGERWIGYSQTTANGIESGPIEKRLPAEPPEAETAPKSIAVLPFVNMSNDPEQDYFSDGISEELLNALAKISELRVAARTSSFSFKGKNRPVPEIGRQLSVETVLEGSVRKSGQRLRITAQLINVADGYHLWSDTYDRDLTDIFEIQDEISAAIVDALRVHLDAPAPTSNETTDVEAYTLLLKARHLVKKRTDKSLNQALNTYQQALDISPDYAAAWAGKALAINLLSADQYGNIPLEQANLEAQSYIDRALARDPEQGLANAVQGLVYLSQHRNQAGLASFDRALRIIPNEGILSSWRSIALFNLGRAKEGVEAIQHGYDIDPLHPVIRHNLSLNLARLNRGEEALALAHSGSAENFRIRGILAGIRGQDADAVNFYRKALALDDNSMRSSDRIFLAFTYHHLNNTEAARELAGPDLDRYFIAVTEPVETLKQLDEIAFSSNSNVDLGAKTIALAKLDDYDTIRRALTSRNFAHSPLYGDPFSKASGAWLASWQALAEAKTGHTEESLKLSRRILDFIDFARSNGDVLGYEELEARCRLILGDSDLVLPSLKQGLANHTIDWRDLDEPWWDSIRDQARFQALVEQAQAHIDEQRKQLGWAPAKWDQ
ncbi:MAG: hypothetical protein ABJN62_04660 [Halioglobus sp.]